MPVPRNSDHGAVHGGHVPRIFGPRRAEADETRGPMFQLRPYQLEMLEESMRRNIIVAMDTGSGKTFIAVSRIEKALERCPPGKFVWFLAPTVALASQQHNVIKSQLPAFQIRFLSGADGVERWSEQHIWDEVLAGINIVVSTHQVLLDALIHGFVKMSQLALLIFDEAHHARADHPASRIMRDFYHPYASTDPQNIPAVLGLTASPVFNNEVGSLQELEKNLQAISRTPKIHREEMLQFVFQPELIQLNYMRTLFTPTDSPELKTLGELCSDLDIEQDPYVIKLRAENSPRSSKKLHKALTSRKTYCTDQLQRFYNRAMRICVELGTWSLNFYMRACIQKYLTGTSNRSFGFDDIDEAEATYLSKIFASIQIPAENCPFLDTHLQVTPKVQRLIDFLVVEQNTSLRALVFVQTRAEVAVLAQLLSRHVQTKDMLKVSTFVGTSTSINRKFDVGELVNVKNQKNTLDDLRSGRSNLIITTTALEEGIDVSACNVVVCFEKPQSMNLKSFIQRRGRARKSASKYVLMIEEGSDSSKISRWKELEAEMRETYMDEMRYLQEIRYLEATEEGEREFRVESTGAKITLHDAVGHLHHFCATLPSDRFVDTRPVFTFSKSAEKGAITAITAKVILPNSVDASVREAYSRSKWKTEKNAKRDAAFQAYIALYYSGLVSDHLLPIKGVDEAVAEAQSAVETITNQVEVPEQIDAWPEVGQEWQHAENVYASTIVIDHNGEPLSEMVILLPRPLPSISDFELYWDHDILFTTIISESCPTPLDRDYIVSAAKATGLLLSSIYKTRMAVSQFDFIALFTVPNAKDLEAWIASFLGTTRADKLLDSAVVISDVGIVRDMTESGKPHIFQGISYRECDGSESAGDSVMTKECEMAVDGCLKVTKLSKRSDFLHMLASQNQDKVVGPGLKSLPASECEVDNLPFAYSRFALFVPSIMHQIETGFAAEHLCRTLLSPVQFNDISLVITATNASVARERTNYQCMEFLGDSRLKLSTSLTLLAEHLHWHEGILSHKKDHVVSNAHLALAALRCNLTQWIRTTPFTGHKWRPPYISDPSDPKAAKKRQISTKTLADVVEALIGAAWLDGGDLKAVECLKIFLPEIPWLPLSERARSLYGIYNSITVQFPPHFVQLEELIGHTFTLKSLLVEAMTHPAHHDSHSSASYQRLEFAGDSILDSIVATIAYAHRPPIPNHTLHLIRTTLVNGLFLAFLCLTLSIPLPRPELTTDPQGNVSTIQTTISSHIWRYMRPASPSVSAAQQACLARYNALKEPILDALENGARYPWSLLARLDAPKFFSDIIESLLGAIYVDTQGSVPACEAFLARLGVMSYLQRFMEGNVALLHPKEELGMLADVEKVKYVVEKNEKAEDEEGGMGRFSCAVWVGKREVAKVGGGISVIEVQTRGAEEAGRVLKEEAGRGEITEMRNDDVTEAEKVSNKSNIDVAMDGTNESGEESDRDSVAYETANEM